MAADDNVTHVLIDRLKSFAATPHGNVTAFRSVAARLHSRAASQDKLMKEKTLECICHRDTGVLALLINLLEVVKDQTLACSLAGILHECVSPKSGKSRSTAISQLVSVNATQSVIKIVMQQQMKDVGLSDAFMVEIMWLLAQMAQRDE